MTRSSFIAGGICITPLRAMLVDLDHRHLDIKATLLYSNRDSDVISKRQLDGLAEKHAHFKIRYFIDPDRLDSHALEPVVALSPDAMFFVSGPEKMVEAVSIALTAAGIPPERLKQDWFPGYAAD
jgi:ferredoxin-NADP reductase